MNKIINPSTPGECTAAMSLSEDGEPHPYMSLLYTVHDGRIRFFALEVVGTETVPAEGDTPESERLLYPGARVGDPPTTNPDQAIVLVSGTLQGGTMSIDTVDRYPVLIAGPDSAVNFIQAIRFVYSMEAQGAESV